MNQIVDTFQAIARAEAARSNGDPARVFDWVKAANLIKERKPDFAAAGLGEDWEWTGGPIFRDGAPVPPEDTDTFLASLWAVPQLNLDGEILDCWVYMEGSDWDQDTYWPPEALAVLNSDE